MNNYIRYDAVGEAAPSSAVGEAATSSTVVQSTKA